MKKWKAELTDVLGRCVQSQDKNLWIANILNLVEQELDRAREEGRREYARELLDDYYQPDSDSIGIDVSEIQKELVKLNK